MTLLDFEPPHDMHQYSSIELGRIFGGDDPKEPMEPQESDGLYEAALHWTRRGYNVVPQRAVDKKHPGVKWKPLQTRRVTHDEMLSWSSMFEHGGVGFITGEISNVIVVETDGLHGETILDEFECEHGPLPKTLTVRSGSMRGFHRYYKHPGFRVATKANPAIKIDVKGDGGFCVLPPSRHKSGGHYEIVHDAEPAALPQGLLEFIEAKAQAANGEKANVEKSKQDGSTFLGEKPEVDDVGLGSNTQLQKILSRRLSRRCAPCSNISETATPSRNEPIGSSAGWP